LLNNKLDLSLLFMLIILSNKEKGALIMLILPIKKWSRKYGYISWAGAYDGKMKDLLISIGSMWTKKLPTNLCEYVLNYEDKNILKVKCR